MPQMIIANRLRDGVVVFLAPDEAWEPAIAAGTLIDNEGDAVTLMAIAKRHEGECQVIDPQLIDVEIRGRPAAPDGNSRSDSRVRPDDPHRAHR